MNEGGEPLFSFEVFLRQNKRFSAEINQKIKIKFGGDDLSAIMPLRGMALWRRKRLTFPKKWQNSKTNESGKLEKTKKLIGAVFEKLTAKCKQPTITNKT